MGIIGQKMNPDNLRTFTGTPEDFKRFIASFSGFILIQVSSPHLCPCKELEVNISEIARQFPHVTIVKIDVFDNPELVRDTFRFEGLPFFQLVEVTNGESKTIEETTCPSVEELKEILLEHTQ